MNLHVQFEDLQMGLSFAAVVKVNLSSFAGHFSSLAAFDLFVSSTDAVQLKCP